MELRHVRYFVAVAEGGSVSLCGPPAERDAAAAVPADARPRAGAGPAPSRGADRKFGARLGECLLADFLMNASTRSYPAGPDPDPSGVLGSTMSISSGSQSFLGSGLPLAPSVPFALVEIGEDFFFGHPLVCLPELVVQLDVNLETFLRQH